MNLRALEALRKKGFRTPILDEEPDFDELDAELWRAFDHLSRSRPIVEGAYLPTPLSAYEDLFRLLGVRGETERAFYFAVLSKTDDAFVRVMNKRLQEKQKLNGK